MPDKITFYAIVDDETTVDRPYGLLRGLNLMVTDSPTRAFVAISAGASPRSLWNGSEATFDDELVEVSHAQASKIIEYFREKWGPFGQPVGS